MNVFLTPSRLIRLVTKSMIRIRLAWKILRGFEDTLIRSTVKVSFSQNGEDLIAWRALNDMGIHRPSYMDIGAHHPFYLSNTALFNQLGMRGVNIEPDPELFIHFPQSRPNDINLNIGLAEKSGILTYYQMSDASLNTFCLQEAERMESQEGITIISRLQIPVENPASVLSNHHFSPDFISMDTEGHDLLILQNWDFEKHRPAVLCVETLSFSTTGEGEKNREISDFLVTQGYKVYADTYINTLYVDRLRGKK
jgi:FkbM family methyltransferase